MMGAAEKPSGFAGRGCGERSRPSFLSGPDWGKCDERPRGLVGAGPTGSRPGFSQAPRGTEPVHDGGLPCSDSTVGRGNSSPPGFSSPLARWVGLAVGLPGCRECGPRRFAMPRLCGGCPDFRSGRILKQPRRQRLPLPSPRGVPALGNYSVCFRWLGGDFGNARLRKDETAGETNYSGKLPIVLRGPRGCRFRENRVWGRLRCRRLFFSDVSAAGKRCRAVPAAAAGAGRYRGGTTPPVPRWYCDFGPFPGMENNRKPR